MSYELFGRKEKEKNSMNDSSLIKLENSASPSNIKNLVSDPWKCHLCFKVLSSKGNLKTHLSNVHRDGDSDDDLFCSICNKIFSCKGNLKAHMDHIHDGRPKGQWKCQYCFKVLSSKGNLKLHIGNIHTRGSGARSSYPCDLCGKVYSSKGNHKAHLENVHNGRGNSINSEEWRCLYCGKVLSTKGNLKIHVNTVHAGEKSHLCSICQKSFSSKGNLRNHQFNLHEGNKGSWPCDYCHKSLSSKGNLKLHLKNVHKNDEEGSSGEEWKCSFCGKKLGSKGSLKTHINNLHGQDLGLVTPISTSSSSSLLCNSCHKTFSSKEHLDNHTCLRLDEKTKETFGPYNSSLQLHLKNEHETPSSYYCEFCSPDIYGRPLKVFNSLKEMQSHMYEKHGVTVAVPEPAKELH